LLSRRFKSQRRRHAGHSRTDDAGRRAGPLEVAVALLQAADGRRHGRLISFGNRPCGDLVLA
jgi:hypothetical protein